MPETELFMELYHELLILGREQLPMNFGSPSHVSYNQFNGKLWQII
jgi:hypothetical protein